MLAVVLPEPDFGTRGCTRPSTTSRPTQERPFLPFGQAYLPPSFRQWHDNQTELVIAVTVLTDEKRLAELLPPDCALEGEPLLTVSMTFKSNIGWLAGRGYSILRTGFRIAHQSKTRGKVAGNFVPVLWENLADPIMTGREELGFAKIYAEMPAPVIIGDSYYAVATWQGFRFFEIDANDLADTSAQPEPAGSFHYKFVPRTGSLGEADAAYLEYAPPNQLATGYGGLRVTRRMLGKGSFKFHRARWEDVPFQYPIINALADLPVLDARGASVTTLAATGAIGDPSAGTLAEIM
jgi:Acetoacetate decarboxylase (ADC)